MCREREVDREMGGTDIHTLTAVQPPTDKGGVGAARSPRPPNRVLALRVVASSNSDKEEERVVNEREGIRPLCPRRTAGQSPRLLPYFPKPGVTSPPPPQSLARSIDPRNAVQTASPFASPSIPATNPAALASRATARSPSPSQFPTRSPGQVASSSPASASRSTTTPRNSSPAPASRATTSRNPSPTPTSTRAPNPYIASRSTARNPSSSPAPKTFARNPSPTPSPRAVPRNPSPSPAHRVSARNPSPAPRTSARSASPAPASKLSPPATTNSPASLASPLVTSTNNKPTRRPASPALIRRDASRSVHSDNASINSTANSAREALLIASPPNVMTKPLSKSTVDLGMSESSSPTFFVNKLTSAELQALRKERISAYGRKVGAPKAGRVACEGMVLSCAPVLNEVKKRCHWVTPQSEPGLISYHDDVWGVPVHDDKLLFELLVLEGAQAELSRPQILGMRDYFREVLGGFDPGVVAKFDERKIAALSVDEVIRQPEAKLRGVIENAKQILKIVQEFGSLDKYLWNFVGFKPIVNSARIFTQIPVKSSKSEALSKDLMRRGFRYVGPTTVYSFMQAAGMVNDHLVTCYRHSECCTTSRVLVTDSSAAMATRGVVKEAILSSLN